MTARWQDAQPRKEALKGFGPKKWVLDHRKMIKLEIKSQRLKDRNQKDKQHKLQVKKMINKKINLITFFSNYFYY